MDETRFDRITRQVAAGVHRRHILRAMLGLGAVGTVALVEQGDALTCRRGGYSCTRNGQCCSGVCRTGTSYPAMQRNTCACENGLAPCGSQCYNFNTDVKNCGRCGNTCLAGSTCTNGVCRAIPTATSSPTTANTVPSANPSAPTNPPQPTNPPPPTYTRTATHTRTATNTPPPTSTRTNTPLPTNTQPPTQTFTVTSTRTRTPTRTPTPLCYPGVVCGSTCCFGDYGCFSYNGVDRCAVGPQCQEDDDCPNGYSKCCRGTCSDLRDTLNCGECNQPCSAGQTCPAGTCRTA